MGVTPLCDKFLELFSNSVNKNITLRQAKMTPLIEDLFHLALSAPAYVQMLMLVTMLHDMELSDMPDKWMSANNTDKYSSQRVYKLIHKIPEVPDTFALAWKTKYQPKQKLFFWLLLHDRLNTKHVLKRRKMDLDSYTCENCIWQKEETWNHLFLRCSFAKRCWEIVGITPTCSSNPHLAVWGIRRKLAQPWSMKTFITMMWCIWRCRNGWIFENTPPTIQWCKNIFAQEMTLKSYRMCEMIADNVRQWIQSL
jgi:hypothetical protein